jgi:hypothetical protein
MPSHTLHPIIFPGQVDLESVDWGKMAPKESVVILIDRRSAPPSCLFALFVVKSAWFLSVVVVNSLRQRKRGFRNFLLPGLIVAIHRS